LPTPASEKTSVWRKVRLWQNRVRPCAQQPRRARLYELLEECWQPGLSNKAVRSNRAERLLEIIDKYPPAMRLVFDFPQCPGSTLNTWQSRYIGATCVRIRLIFARRSPPSRFWSRTRLNRKIEFQHSRPRHVPNLETYWRTKSIVYCNFSIIHLAPIASECVECHSAFHTLLISSPCRKTRIQRFALLFLLVRSFGGLQPEVQLAEYRAKMRHSCFVTG